MRLLTFFLTLGVCAVSDGTVQYALFHSIFQFSIVFFCYFRVFFLGGEFFFLTSFGVGSINSFHVVKPPL